MYKINERLPLLPDVTRQHRSHDFPVPSGALLMPLGNLAGLVLVEHICSFTLKQELLLNLVLWQQQVASDLALEEVLLGRATKGNVSRSLAAENDHVGEVASPLLDIGLCACMLTEDSA